jgi:hypothetical protein
MAFAMARTALGCIGPNCENGLCKGDGCLTIGCVGSDCDHSHDDDDDDDGDTGGKHGGGRGHGKHGRCVGPHCTALGCAGPDCTDSNHKDDSGKDDSGKNDDGKDEDGKDDDGKNDDGKNDDGKDDSDKDDSDKDDSDKHSRDCPSSGCDGECEGPKCTKFTCFGLDCLDGSCVGPLCFHAGANEGGDDEAPTENPDDQCDSPQSTASSCDVVCKTAPTSTCTTDCVSTKGCSATGTTSTTTISSDAYFIPTAVYDSYWNDDAADEFVMSIVASVISSEDALDAGQLITSGSKASTAPPKTTSYSTVPTTSTAPPAPTGATLCLASRHIGRDTGSIWSLFNPGMCHIPSTSVGSFHHARNCINDGITGHGCDAGAFTGMGDSLCDLDGTSFKNLNMCGINVTFHATGSDQCDVSIEVDGETWTGTTLLQGDTGPCSDSCPFPGGDALELRGTVSWSGPMCARN